MRSPFDIILEFINEKIWLAVFVLVLYVRTCPKKERFALKAVLGGLGVLVFGLLPSILTEFFPFSEILQFWNSREQFIWPILMTMYLGTMYKSGWNMNVFAALTGLCTQEIMYGIWSYISIKIPAAATLVGELICCSVISVLLAVALYFFMAKKITPRSFLALQKRSLIPLILLYLVSVLILWHSTFVILFMMLSFDSLQETLQQAGGFFGLEKVRMAVLYTSVLANVIILLALRHMLRYSESDLERELLEQIREQDRKQFTHFRNNVDYINTKTHDLRHYLSLLQRNEKLPERELRQVSESILHLDSETDSGNETLDMILIDRRLVCASEGIELIFQTDGTSLEQLDTIDIFGIFCNILDNAIGYVKNLPQEDRRIHLGIRTIHGMVFIHQENPLNETLEMKDGLPVTTQPDQTLHGLGLKSVQNTVKKRGGEFAIWAEGGRFELEICFPKEKEQEK